MSERVCFVLQVRPEMLEEYKLNHQQVWPEMLREIEASGRTNYSIFLRGDGLLIGYYETASLAASAEFLDRSAIAARWEREMADYFVQVDGRADHAEPLTEVFNLATALDELRGNTDSAENVGAPVSPAGSGSRL